MISFLAVATVVVIAAIVLLVAYHLVFILVALTRAANHLQKLAGGLVAIRDNTKPLNGKIDAINAGLAALIPALLAANDNIARIAGALTPPPAASHPSEIAPHVL